MKLNKPKTTPDKYITFGGNTSKKIHFKDQYKSELPVPSRFGQPDLLDRISNRRLNLNDLNFVPEGEMGDGYEMFPGRGRFDMEVDYDFAIGRPNTPNYPEQQPDFDPLWNDAYSLSPVIAPEEKIKNPFPRQNNLDPNGYLQAMVEADPNTEIPALPDLINENPQAQTSIG